MITIHKSFPKFAFVAIFLLVMFVLVATVSRLFWPPRPPTVVNSETPLVLDVLDSVLESWDLYFFHLDSGSVDSEIALLGVPIDHWESTVEPAVNVDEEVYRHVNLIVFEDVNGTFVVAGDGEFIYRFINNDGEARANNPRTELPVIVVGSSVAIEQRLAAGSTVEYACKDVSVKGTVVRVLPATGQPIDDVVLVGAFRPTEPGGQIENSKSIVRNQKALLQSRLMEFGLTPSESFAGPILVSAVGVRDTSISKWQSLEIHSWVDRNTKYRSR